MEDNTVAEYDLLPTLVTKLDRHLIFPLLEFRRGQLENEDGVSRDEAKSKELLKATYELLNKTNMTDYVANLYCDLEGLQDPPKEFADKRQKVLETLEKYEDTTGKIQELLGREDVVTNLRSDKVANLEFLKKEHDVRTATPLLRITNEPCRLRTGGRAGRQSATNTVYGTKQSCDVVVAPLVLLLHPHPDESDLLLHADDLVADDAMNR